MRHGFDLNSRGLSLVEVLVALAVISVAMGVFVMFSQVNRQQNFSDASLICHEASQAMIDNFRSLGFENKTAVADLAQNRIAPTDLDVVTQTVLFPQGSNTPLYQMPPTGNVQLHSHRSIVGSIAALTAILNSDSRFCSSPGGWEYTSLSGGISPPSDPNGLLRDARSFLRIEMLNTLTGEVRCPSGPVQFLPTSEKNPASGQSFVQDLPNTFSNDWAYRLTVRTSYRLGTSGNAEKSCSESAVFRYPRNPASAGLLDTMTIAYTRSPSSSCLPLDPGGQLTITLEPGFDRNHGMVPLCRDRSSFAAGRRVRDCTTGVTSTSFSMPTPQRFVPCNEVTVCNQRPISSTISSDRRVITNQYKNLPWGCDILVEGLNVDPARNISPRVEGPGGFFLGAQTAINSPCNSDCPPGWTVTPACPQARCSAPPAPPTTVGGGRNGGGGVGFGGGRAGGGGDGGGGRGGGLGPDGSNGGLSSGASGGRNSNSPSDGGNRTN